MNKKIWLILLFPTLLFSAYFETGVKNTTSQCPSWETYRFDEVKDYQTFGVSGSTQYGFDHEISISREGVDILWCAVKIESGLTENICSKWFSSKADIDFKKFEGKQPDGKERGLYRDRADQYRQYLKFIKEEMTQEQMDIGINVGVILEILTRYYFYEISKNYPKSRYTVTGGVSYAKRANTNILGELDIIVYDKHNCEVVLLGEAKATTPRNMPRMLQKAKDQLKRFEKFIDIELKK